MQIIEDQKFEIKAQSKIGSLDNVKHKPGGGEVKIFDDKSYIKQTAGQIGNQTKSQVPIDINNILVSFVCTKCVIEKRSEISYIIK